MKKIVLINDISGAGKVATVGVLPLLSALCIESYVLPTVMLSTHSGGLGTPVKIPIIQEFSDILAHWQRIPLTRDAVLTGYFASQEQIDIVLHHKLPNDFLVVDPIMADNGKLYASFAPTYPKQMAKLAFQADMLLPNWTEACLLLNVPYVEHPSKQQVIAILERLHEHVPVVVITGVTLDDGSYVVCAIDDKGYCFFENEHVPGHYFGTGDIFSAVLTALLLKGATIEEGIKHTIAFIVKCVHHTYQLERDVRFGVVYEPFIKELISIGEIYDK